MKKIYKYLFVLTLLMTSTVAGWAQYSSKKMEISNDTYYGTVEVCVGCDNIKVNSGQTYVALANNKLQIQEGKLQGKPLHGVAKLFFKSNKKPYMQASFFGGKYHQQCKEWTEDGEAVMDASFNKGIKHGKVVNYVFGNIETEDVYDNGVLKAQTSFDPESKKPITKVEIKNLQGDNRSTKATFFGSRNILEVDRKEQWKNGQLISAYYDGAYVNKDPKGQLIEKGTYKMNEKVGTWERMYPGGIKAITVYDNDKIKSEKFVKDGKPFTGTVRFGLMSSKTKKMTDRLTIEVKNGVRNGKTTYLWGAGVQNTVNYTNGKVAASEDLEAFLKGQKIVKEYQLKKQCDGRGKGLFVEKVQVTDKNTIVYCHYRNVLLSGGAGLGTPSAGKKDGFTMIDVDTKKVNKLKRTFFIQNDKVRKFVYYGEMINFVLIFDKLSNTTKTVSFVEGDEAYVTQNGSDLYKWGCYDLKLK